jgi:hypothetical protein
VIAVISLPNSVELVAGTTKLYKKDLLAGATYEEDKIATAGVNIGEYEEGDQANVIYTVRIKNGLEDGKIRAISWAKISVSDISITNQDNADIYMRR